MQMLIFTDMKGKEITKQYFISMYLDTRRAKENGKFPVRLRVFTPSPRKQKLYSTKFEFSRSEYESIWETIKPREIYKAIRKEMQAIVNEAEETAEELKHFDFTEFEKKLFNVVGAESNVFWQYEQEIKELERTKRIGSLTTYKQSLNSLKAYLLHLTGKEQNKILFSEITAKWLQNYENYMVNDLGRSVTTVGFYLRALRAIFNNAKNEIGPDAYPFGKGKGKYTIPAVKNVKKALHKTELKRLFEAKAKNSEQEKAKDFWFFSYSCNGMNIKDIAHLKFENLNNDEIVFIRAKTVNTKKDKSTPIRIYLNDFTKAILKKYCNKDNSPKNYIFSIISSADNDLKKYHKVKNFTRFINQNLKKIAIDNDITEDISTYWARHSFATNAIRNGASMEFVNEALNHSDMKTTKGYFAGFADETKKEFSEALMKF